MDRTQKEETVAALHAALQETGLVVVTQQSGMTVAEVTDLRRKMRAAGATASAGTAGAGTGAGRCAGGNSGMAGSTMSK